MSVRRHLHLELRKISYEINSIFGIQMTCKMGSNFLWLAFDLRETFSVIFINNFIEYNRTLYYIINIFWICLDSLKLFLINYICETVTVKVLNLCFRKTSFFLITWQLRNYYLDD